MVTVFLSYARADAEMVDRIAGDLTEDGINIWLSPDQLNPGESWVEQMEGAIAGSDFLLFFISRSSLKSQCATAEYGAAFASLKEAGGTRIIPVLLEEVRDLSAFLAHVQYADFTKSYYRGMRGLVRALHDPAGIKPNEIIELKKLAEQIADQRSEDPRT